MSAAGKPVVASATKAATLAVAQLPCMRVPPSLAPRLTSLSCSLALLQVNVDLSPEMQELGQGMGGEELMRGGLFSTVQSGAARSAHQYRLLSGRGAATCAAACWLSAWVSTPRQQRHLTTLSTPAHQAPLASLPQ